MDNEFAAFAAGKPPAKKKASTSGGGWMTTKKRGRDDDRIAQDRKKAIDARKVQRSRGRQPPKLKAGAKAKKGGASKSSSARTTKKSKGGRRRSADYDDSDEEEDYYSDGSEESEASFQGYDETDDEVDSDNFIADSDEEMSVGDSTDDELEIVESTSGSRRRGKGRNPPAARGGRNRRGGGGTRSSSDASMSSATEDDVDSPLPKRQRSAAVRGRAAAMAARKREAEDDEEEEKKQDDDDDSDESSDDDRLFGGKKRKANKANTTISTAGTSGASSDSDATDEEDATLPSKKKQSTTSRYLNIPKKGESSAAGATGKKKAAGSSRRSSEVFGNDSDDDDDDDDFGFTSNNTGRGSQNNAAAAASASNALDDSSDDDEGYNEAMSRYVGVGAAAKKRGTKFYQKRDSRDSAWVDGVANVRNKGGIDDNSSPEDDLFESDDDEEAAEDEELALAMALSKSLDEANGVNGGRKSKKLGGAKKAAAKKQQKAAAKKRKKKVQRVTVELSPNSDDDLVSIPEEKKGNIIDLADDKSDSELEDEDVEEVDEFEYADDAEREAGKILNVAIELSKEVIRAMSKWSSSSKKSAGGSNADDNEEEIKAPKGMIVDGALAMATLSPPDTAGPSLSDTQQSQGEPMDSSSSLAAPSGDNSIQAPKHEWISNEKMQEICPGLKLADYQLIGVNWLALLHGMQVRVSDGIMNVNGVLCDEMGLGKTVQTIAFLAWLKYGKSPSGSSKASSANDEEEKKMDVEESKSPSGSSKASSANDEEEKKMDVEESDVEVIGEDSDDEHNDHDEEVATDKRRQASRSVSGNPHIIIVPASVLSNWEREIEKFCPSLKVVKFHGSMQEREDLRDEMRTKYLPSKSGKKAREKLDVVLTTFSYFSKEKSEDRSFLRRFHFDYMVVDEAHQLKNPKGLRYQNMDKFITSHRLLLTGTPIQNSPKELMSLLCFLMPLFSKRAAAFEDAENDGGAAMLEYFVSVQEGEKSKSNDGRGGDAQAYRKLKQLLAPFCLRRRKDEGLKQIMPEKTRVVLKVPFDEAGKKIYDSIIKKHVEAKERGNIVDDAATQNHLFTSLRKAANHPLLLRNRHTSEEAIEHIVHHTNTYGYWGNVETATDKKELIRRELAKFSDFDLHGMAFDLIHENPLRAKEMERYKLEEEDLFCSPKFVKLRTLIPQLIKEGHRMLIFSQWKMCLDLLDCLLESMGLEHLRIDGSTDVKERQALMDQFNESDIPVFLLSTRAGGMGINLTGADTCILHDLDFNPFNDLQAEDRCHRIGQTKPVTVYKMVTQDTVDAAIHEMQEQKKKMNAAIIGDGGESVKEQKKQDAEAVNSMVQSAVSRFFATSPEAKSKKKSEDTDGSDSDDFL